MLKCVELEKNLATMDIDDSKLVILLKTFNKQEFDRLEKFVNSPFFNSSEQLIALFNLLKEYHPEYTGLTKEKIFDHFYPKEIYKDKKVRDLLSRLLELVESFLGQLEFEKKQNMRNAFIMNQLIERNLKRHYNSKLKESEKKLREQTNIDDYYLYSNYLFSKLNKLSASIFSNISYEEKSNEFMFREFDYFLDYAIYGILKYTFELFISKYAINNEFNPELPEKIIEYLDKYPRDKYPIIPILRNVLKLQKRENESLSDEDVNIYHILKKQLEENSSAIHHDDKKSIYVYLVNYTRLKSLASNKYFKDDHYQLVKYSIENDMYPKEGKYFNEASFVVVASTAMINKDFKWAEEFIEKFKHELKDDVRENAYTLSMANLKYRTGKHEEALQYLVKVSIEDIYYQLKVKNLQIKIHYELGNFEMCASVIDSFRHFLSSVKQFPEFIKTRFVNYVNFTSRMVNVHLGGDPRNMVLINKEIQSISQEKVESKSWLLAQAEKIKY